ncbi:MAG: RNA methyltransferase [Candidatus Syntrophonatronum acetioxidans]|uniref:RNA methyltransferase n=1 Tax=Candidatus Syntrophonatronum acetioxidans TaxID=1795816 RepID=A0A424YGW6_9FIRM|nr:MAG: RNA methyltransferase [Candidatus Syntrophonatronum acetioxidans]
MVVTSLQNPEVKLYRSLLRKRGRDKKGLIPLEGIRLIEEAVANQAELHRVIYSEEFLKNERGRELLEDIQNKQPQVKPLNVSRNILKEAADTENPQGILAAAVPPESSLSQLTVEEKPLIIVAAGIQDPGNLGTIIRTAAAASVSGVVVTRGTVDIHNPKTLRATMGAIFNLPVVLIKDVESLISYFRQLNTRLAVTDLEGDVNCFQVDLTVPTAVFFGSEAFGLDREIRKAADYRLKIPLLGPAESLNVAVAAGVIMYEGVRQKHYSI